jgi:5-bromo-4-chloroindolyl phosphate hydrolysis protein
MYPSRTPESGAFRSVVPSYGQLEQEVRSLYDQAEFYKKELEDALRLVEKLKKELNREQG